MNIVKILVAAVLGIASALLSSVEIEIISSWGLAVMPGLYFGLAVLIYISIFPAAPKMEHSSWGYIVRKVLFLIFSIFGYSAAYFFTIVVYSTDNSELVNRMVLILAGILGAVILLVGVRIIKSIGLKRFFVLVFLGGILSQGLGLSLGLVGRALENMIGGLEVGFFSLFLIWQIGMLFGIVWTLED
tara:strand:- start:433 stop:993 length:561 start_codon:yes stop_codon:yes gene_type:complete